MYRCYLCKELVTNQEYRDVKSKLGTFTEDEMTGVSRACEDDDCFDKEGYVVICMNCLVDAEIELSRRWKNDQGNTEI